MRSCAWLAALVLPGCAEAGDGTWSAESLARRYADAVALGNEERLSALFAPVEVARRQIQCPGAHPADGIAAAVDAHLARLRGGWQAVKWDYAGFERHPEALDASCTLPDGTSVATIVVKVKHVPSGKSEEIRLQTLVVDDWYYVLR
jgi:hypothetical protein